MSDETWHPRKRDKLVGAALWGAGLSWIVPMMSSMMASGAVLDSDHTQWLDRLYCRGQVKLTGSRWRSVVSPEIDPDGVYMFAQNHVNLLDHVTMYPATPHYKQGMELESHFKIPVYGWFMKQRGTIGVRRGEGKIDHLREQMRAEQARGHSILAFPEGTRTRTGRVGPFRKGLFYLARDLSMPIVPTTVTGMFEVLRTGSWVMRPGHEVTVYCDAPIETAGLSDEEIPDLVERVRTVVAGRVDAYYEERKKG